MLKSKSSLKNQKGMAVLEMIPLIIIIMILFVFTFGFFGAIHTGIIASISTRNYAFETMRHRADLTYFRDVNQGNYFGIYYSKNGFRSHNRVDRNTSESVAAVGRRIDFMKPSDPEGTAEQYHNDEIPKIKYGVRYTEADGTNPIWVRTRYGICLNQGCGD